MRYLGLSGRILKRPDLQAPNQQGLSQWVLYLYDVLRYLDQHHIHCYRLPAWPYELLNSWPEAADQIHLIGEYAQQAKIRLTYHVPSNVLLNSHDQHIRHYALNYLTSAAAFLTQLGSYDPVIVVHIGAQYGDRAWALAQTVASLQQLDPAILNCLALEADGRVWSLLDALHIHAQTKIPVIFDWLHHQLYNPAQLNAAAGLEYALATWPSQRKPKVHFSSPRTEIRLGQRQQLLLPTWHEHSDLANPFELISLLRLPFQRDYDLMLEVKAGDLALERARSDLQRFAPELVDVE
ncbi:hypothetical protein [Herpetosiphon llansteffanensis]|uniref:hypothetical protein n=1 Tax=Herpetosiphon llansteffanensis TaxID=2094568 RepID=UPI000D7C393C|nr:hypothetical protein [Herpetosiphon llansteffanensis]